MLLNKFQAETIYNAICVLNKIGNVSSEFNLPDNTWVQITSNGAIMVVPWTHGAKIERYENQSEFAIAYKIKNFLIFTP